jgi:3-deoxy-7-phosphoheptulonate synthase
MIIKLKNDIQTSVKNKFLQHLEEQGFELQPNGGSDGIQIRILSEVNHVQIKELESHPVVERVFSAGEIYSLAQRESKQENTVIKLPGINIGEGSPIVIAGPCAVESESQILEVARLVSSQGVKIMRGGAFKPRTSPYSFSGLEEKGLKLLDKARRETGVLIVTEVMDTRDVEQVAEYSDILQIGSRNMQNYKLLKTVGNLKKPVLLKRGMSATLEEFLGSAEYILAEGNEQIILCERGIRTFVDYSRNTLDLNVVPVIKNVSHLPIIVDPSHGTGRRDIIEPMSLAALAAGADGIMVEVHPNPEKAWSDPEQALSPEQFTHLMRNVTDFIEWRKTHAFAPIES